MRALADIRRDFPALAGGLAFLDGPGGTQVPAVVIDAMRRHLVERNGNTHWNSPTSRATDASVTDARETFAAFFGGRADEVVFGANATTLAFHVSRGLGNAWQAGDEVIVTELDHHANIAPWQALARERGIVLRWLPMDPVHGTLRLEALPALLTSRTRLVALGGASNAIGTINDIAEVARIAHNAGVLVFVDGVHLAPHRLLDVAAWDVDFVTTSPYKYYGPHMGAMWGRKELLQRVATPKLAPAADTAPERIETGTQNFEAMSGGAAAIRWLADLVSSEGTLRARLGRSYAAMQARESALFEKLWDGLTRIDGITPVGLPPGGERTATVAFRHARFKSDDVSSRLADVGIAATHGDFYAATAVERLGAGSDGFVRLGLAVYSSEEEVERVISAIGAI